eukprot:2996423-Amphidinium_carterae.1
MPTQSHKQRSIVASVRRPALLTHAHAHVILSTDMPLYTINLANPNAFYMLAGLFITFLTYEADIIAQCIRIYLLTYKNIKQL